MPSHVDHVVDASEDAEVAVLGLQRSVAGEVRPVVPVLAVILLVVLRVVGRHESIRVSIDGLEDAGPGIADDDVARLLTPLWNRIAVLVEDLRINTEDARAAAPGLHRLQSGQRTAQEASVLGLPPGVD